MPNLNIAIIGASGGIGNAFVKLLSNDSTHIVHALSRSDIKSDNKNVHIGKINFTDESSISAAAERVTQHFPLDLVIVASGVLHDTDMTPEKSLRDLSATNFERNFFANTIVPSLVAKHFLPKMQRNKRAVFAALSARVGSISDNRLGGWYAYRASKAALNMVIKTTSIEIARRQKQTIVVGLHPGTVATKLSEPFQKRVQPEKLFTADVAAKQLVDVLNNLSEADSGKIFAWDGSEVPY